MELFFLCLKVFLARLFDVTLGTTRTVNAVKGRSVVAALIGFIEVFVWFVVVKEALNTSNPSLFIPLAYAGGFATGTFIGTKISDKFIKGFIGVNVVTEVELEELVKKLRESGYAVSKIKLDDENQNKKMLYIQIMNNKLKELTNIIKSYDKKAFIVASETKFIQNGFIK